MRDSEGYEYSLNEDIEQIRRDFEYWNDHTRGERMKIACESRTWWKCFLEDDIKRLERDFSKERDWLKQNEIKTILENILNDFDPHIYNPLFEKTPDIYIDGKGLTEGQIIQQQKTK